jgi:PAS domain S-box-containing protein
VDDSRRDGQHILVVAPFGKDAESIAQIVRQRGCEVSVRPTMDALSTELGEHIGAVVITEEALGGELSSLRAALSAQPAWSDIPFLVLRAVNRRHPGRSVVLPHDAMNVIELERPLGATSLMSAVMSALRSRQKQFVIRDQMKRLSESQAALAASEAELRLVADALPVLIAFVDSDLVYRFANRSYEQWLGVPLDQIIGRTVREIIGESAWMSRKDEMERALGGEAVLLEASWPYEDGRRREIEIRYLPRFTQAGAVDGLHVFATDITVRRVALEESIQHAALLESRVAERTAELQEQVTARRESDAALRQAQKMEAVGQLTGGIAHDFNNMLTGILSAIDLIRMRLAAGNMDKVDRFLEIASTSALRAAGLTQRLLAFSRRQSLDATSLDVGKLIVGLHELLAGTLGEQIRLRFEIAPGVPAVLVDSNQLESALLNLAINARDAMPGGGELCIACRLADEGDSKLHASGMVANVAGGSFVAITVSDTGVGMPKDVVDRVFEPFFTTKPIGQGTGLGMSMIYGFMQQSNGHVQVDSVVGEGTAVTLYLPVAASASHDHPDSARTLTTGGGQQLLIVEDDDQVRALVTEVLSELGYGVQAVPDADQAIPILKSRQSIDLLITDVGLPGLNGRQLADIARESRPELPVLFMTGYAETAANRSAFLGTGMNLIAKPFALDDFSRQVGQILSSDEPRTRPSNQRVDTPSGKEKTRKA